MTEGPKLAHRASLGFFFTRLGFEPCAVRNADHWVISNQRRERGVVRGADPIHERLFVVKRFPAHEIFSARRPAAGELSFGAPGEAESGSAGKQPDKE